MPRTKGTKQLNCEVTDNLFDLFRTFCDDRGETLRTALEQAMARHMASPPPPPVPPPPLPPLPPVAAPSAEVAPPKSRAKRKR